MMCTVWEDGSHPDKKIGEYWLEVMTAPDILYEFEPYSMARPKPFKRFSELEKCPKTK